MHSFSQSNHIKQCLLKMKSIFSLNYSTKKSKLAAREITTKTGKGKNK